jgi:large subunit ribosomal protein L7/L12
MSTDAAVREFSSATTSLGDQIAGLTLKQAVELSDYLKDKYGIEPAAGGAVMMAGPVGGAPAEKPAEKTEFDVILKGFDAAKKVNVIKVVREITAMSLMDGKKAVEGAPTKLKEGVSKEEAEQLKKKVEEAGGQVEIK